MRKIVDVITLVAFVALVWLSINWPSSTELPRYGTVECEVAQDSLLSRFVPVCSVD